MTLERRIIRDKCKELLLNRTAAKGEVYINRSKAFWQETIPSISIYTRSESNIEQYTHQPRQFKRYLELAVEIVVDGENEENATNQLDEIAAEVEDILTSDTSLGGTCEDITISSVQCEFESTSELPVGFCTLRFDILYLRESPKSKKYLEPLVDFNLAHVEYTVNGSTTTHEDDIEVNP